MKKIQWNREASEQTKTQGFDDTQRRAHRARSSGPHPQWAPTLFLCPNPLGSPGNSWYLGER